jgi:hypothetical protein
MDGAISWLSIVVNVVAIIATIVGVGRWFRRRVETWITLRVTGPMASLTTRVDTMAEELKRIHLRFDQHLEGHPNG